MELALATRSCSTDFLAATLDRIGEPLRLRECGQQWFQDVYRFANVAGGGTSLVLGATGWLAHFLAMMKHPTFVVDMSGAMLSIARCECGCAAESVAFVQGNWFQLPETVNSLRLVVGDNSFSFLRFPQEWALLRDELAERMNPGATLIMRAWSPPPFHHPQSPEALVRAHAATPPVNYTAVRTALLFSQRSRSTFAINTESALRQFEDDRHVFLPLLQNAAPDNDLETIVKYRQTHAVYYAPPLEAILDLLAPRFAVTSVHFGLYSMGAYFPLIVGVRT